MGESQPRRRRRQTTKLLLELPSDLAFDLVLFCEAHYGAPKNVVIREALRDFIQNALQNEPQLRERFEAVRANLVSEAEPDQVSQGTLGQAVRIREEESRE
jgi:hypothetical protein